MQSLLERAVVLGFGAGQASVSPALCDLIVQYAAILAAQVSLSAVRQPCLPFVPRADEHAAPCDDLRL